MAQSTPAIGPATGPGPWRVVGRRLTPIVFLAALGVAIYFSVQPLVQPEKRGTRAAAAFSHVYPPDRVPVSHQSIPGTTPVAPRSSTVTGRRVTSFAGLKRVLPTGVLRPVGKGDWLLTHPAAIGPGASLSVSGPGSLEIGPGAFLESVRGGSIVLRGLRITAVGSDRKPLDHLVFGRGFVFTDEGRLVLDHDTVTDLGYLSDLAFGLSFRSSLAGSAVLDSTITGCYRGVYTTAAAAVLIERNEITHSVEYGIDPHTDSVGLVIDSNQVVASGVHGIILAVGVQQSRVTNNVVDGAGDHGIVLFDRSNANLVQGNQVRNTDDGIVVIDSSYNRISNNMVGPVIRFGLRMSGVSRGNVVEADTFGHALLGAYVYGGATQNSLRDDTFVADKENVRVRADASDTRVSPVPPRSEVP